MSKRFPGAHILEVNGICPKIAEDAFIAPGAVIVGDVEIGPGSSVWFNAVLRGDVAPIRVGAARISRTSRCSMSTAGIPASSATMSRSATTPSSTAPSSRMT